MESTASPVAFGELLPPFGPARHHAAAHSLRKQKPEGQGLEAIEGAGMAWQHELAIFWRRADGCPSPICQDFRDAVVKWCEQTEA
ncbi:hypothetical protein ACTMU2_41285 [Cupriavidus basilensis]